MRFLKTPSLCLKSWAIGGCLADSFFVTSCDVPKPDQSDSKPSGRKDTANGSDHVSSDKPKDFASVAKSLSALQSAGAQGGEAAELLKEAVKISPKQAAEWTAMLPPGLNKDACLEIIFKSWSQKSPKDAAQFAKSYLKGVDYRLALASVAEGTASSSPETAVTLLAGENELLLRSVLIDSLVSEAIDAHSDFLAEWTAALPLGNNRDKAISSLVEEWSMKATTV